MMTNDDVLREFREAGALREGHFVLSSGLHSAIFLQKNLVFMYPDRCERLCRALAAAIIICAVAIITIGRNRGSKPAAAPAGAAAD